MENLRFGGATCVVLSALLFACSHDDDRAERARVNQTAGDERRDRDDDRDRRANRPDRVADRDADDEVTRDAPTALDQSNDARDLEITQAIRQAVVRDDSLSFTARNVTIVTVDQVVTLRGPVNTAAEREAIERHARSVDGVERVDNLIDVAP